MGSLAPLAIALLTHGPELFEGAEELFNALAHGPGGTVKIAGALGALQHLTGAIANAAQVVQSAGQQSGSTGQLANQQTGTAAETGAEL